MLTLATSLVAMGWAGPTIATENAISLNTVGGISLGNQSGAAALLAKAAKGKVRVIVGLGMQLADESSLSAAGVAAQKAQLSSAQSSLLSRIQGGTRPDAVKFETIPFVSIWVTRDELARLLNDGAVTSIQEDVPAEPYLTQSVPLINGDDVWATGKQGAGEVVAILDTGVRKTHVMFPSGKVVSEACYSTNSAGTTSFCPSGASAITGSGTGLNCPTGIPGCDHGTHVAGIVAGNHPDLKGVAPAAQLIPIQVFSRFNNDGDCGGAGTAPCIKSFTSDQIKGLERVYALRSTYDIAAVNMSLGGGSFSSTCDSNSAAQTAIINNLRNAGIATVIASGNDSFNGTVGAPSCISSAISVGSSTKTDGISSFSNHAPIVKLLAPGSDIRSAGATSDVATTFKSGTSMATPHVAGAWALMADVKEGAGVSEILSALNCTGVQLARGGLFRPRINLLAARNELLAANPTRNFPFTNVNDGTFFSKFINSWTVTGGTFRGTFTGSNIWTLAAHKYCSPAFRVSARMRKPVAAEQIGGVALFSNIVSSGGNVVVSGYIFHFDPTDVRIRRFNNVSLTGFGVIGNSFNDVCVTAKSNSAASYHTIRVDAIRGSYAFYADGTLICTLSDKLYPPAWVGIISSRPTSSTTGHSIWVDTLTITPLSTAGASALVASSDSSGSSGSGIAQAAFTAADATGNAAAAASSQ